jgi:hypothetical protein
MDEVKALHKLKKALSAELESRPKEEVEALRAITGERAMLRRVWSAGFPWFPLSRLTPEQETEFLNDMKDGFARVKAAEARGDYVPPPPMLNPHVRNWIEGQTREEANRKWRR